MKRVALADLAVNLPATPAPAAAERAGRSKPAPAGRKGIKLSGNQDSKIASDQDSDDRAQVPIRMSRDGHKELKRMALDEDVSVNDLVLRAINEMRERKGLKKL